MLQLVRETRAACAAIPPTSESASVLRSPESLEAETNALIRSVREARERDVRSRVGRAHAWLDNVIRTEALEHLDEPDFPDARKVRIVRALHRMNRVLGSYRRFATILRPLVAGVVASKGRPARILELASGSGEFSLEIAKRIQQGELNADITGSDYVPAHVHAAQELAERRGLPARFEVINAFEMAGIDQGQFDIVFIAQSIHHFTPGQLAMMIAAATRVATTAFVGVDGRRGLGLLAFLPLAAALRGRPDYVHDATITARKLYSEPELELIARRAAPAARVEVRTSRPGMSVLTVRVAE